MKKNTVSQFILITVLLFWLFIILFPLYWAVIISFDSNAMTKIPDFSIWPSNPSFHAYNYASRVIDLGRYYLNTLIITFCNTVISVFFALTCGYAFAKGNFLLKKFWFYVMLAVMIIPFETRLLPLFLQYQRWGLINTYWPLILNAPGYVFGIIFARQNIISIPDSLGESAFIDGANEWGIFFKIILPLSKPVIATLSILLVLQNWNAYLWPLVVLRSRKLHTISIGIAFFNASENSAYYSPRMAVAVLSSVPLVVLFLFLQKFIVQSMAMQGIKQ